MTGGVLVASDAGQPGRGRTAAVREHGNRRAADALGHGLQGGTLTYRAQADGSPYSVVNQARGTYTKLPAAGKVIRQGHVLYRVDDRPVVLLYGSTPAYRTLSAGASRARCGRAQRGSRRAWLHHPRSSTAVRRLRGGDRHGRKKLQAALGVSETGTLTLGKVVFAARAVRVTSVSAGPGPAPSPSSPCCGHLVRPAGTDGVSPRSRPAWRPGTGWRSPFPTTTSTSGVVSSVGRSPRCPPSSGSGWVELRHGRAGTPDTRRLGGTRSDGDR